LTLSGVREVSVSYALPENGRRKLAAQ
jgi:hypothetical protein